MKNVALIVAGGQGSRLNSNTPKQYLKLNNASILRLTLEKFITHPQIDGVKVVIREEDFDLYQESIKGLKLLPHSIGGKTRQNSVYNGLVDLKIINPKNVLIHDSVRPFVDHRIISEVIKMLNTYEAVDVGVEITDTIKKFKPITLENRNDYYLTQTPQGFNYKKIMQWHENHKNQTYTDDISLAISEQIEISVVKGTAKNIKITNFDELKYGEFLVEKNYIPRIGYGFDIHKFIETSDTNNTIKIGAIDIPFNKSLKAHSDGDVVLHALTDAILGALGEEDIGMHFPPSDNKWKNADSTIFLQFAKNLIDQKAGIINNIDITIVTEKPKLMEYKNLMRKKIAEILSISNNQISVKAKTSEKLGFIGREEGISCSAVCLIMLPIS